MITDFIEAWFLCILISSLALQFGYLLFLLLYNPGWHRDQAVTIRMKAYGHLDHTKRRNCSGASCDDACCLTDEGYAALLGTLKKVEQKNASLVTVLVFAHAAFLSGLFASGGLPAKDQLMLIASALLLLPLAGAIFGMKQLDSWDIGFSSTRMHQEQIKEELKRDMLKSLSIKELLFRFEWKSTIITVPLVIFILIASGIETHLSKYDTSPRGVAAKLPRGANGELHPPYGRAAYWLGTTRHPLDMQQHFIAPKFEKPQSVLHVAVKSPRRRAGGTPLA